MSLAAPSTTRPGIERALSEASSAHRRPPLSVDTSPETIHSPRLGPTAKTLLRPAAAEDEHHRSTRPHDLFERLSDIRSLQADIANEHARLEMAGTTFASTSSAEQGKQSASRDDKVMMADFAARQQGVVSMMAKVRSLPSVSQRAGERYSCLAQLNELSKAVSAFHSLDARTLMPATSSRPSAAAKGGPANRERSVSSPSSPLAQAS